jgi:hypothetical protein
VLDEDLTDAHDANVLREARAEHRRASGTRRLTAEIRDRGHALEPQEGRPAHDRGRTRRRAQPDTTARSAHASRPARSPRTWSDGSAPPSDQTSYGSLTSPTGGPAEAFSTSLWSSTPAPAASWAGPRPITYDASWSSTPWAWPFSSATPSPDWSTTGITAPTRGDPPHRTPRRGRRGCVGRLGWDSYDHAMAEG